MKGNNPLFPEWEYVPDGEPRLFGDRVYLFGSHDKQGGKTYCEKDYVCWSAPIDNLGDWYYEGIIYRRNQDLDNLDGKLPLFAPDVIQGFDGRFYLYYALPGLSHISVAVSNVPQGPYEYYGKVEYSDKGQLEKGIVFDPSILIDGDKCFLYYGFTSKDIKFDSNSEKENKGAYGVELSQDMKTIISHPICVALGGEAAECTDFEKHPFFEASSVRKYDNKYYFIYSSAQGHELCYAISQNPLGPYRYKGVIISNANIGFEGNLIPQNQVGNNHGGLLKLENQYYIFYHRHTHGTHYSRQACAEQIILNPDGTINQIEMTTSGVKDTILAKGKISASQYCQLYSDKGKSPYSTVDQDKLIVTNMTGKTKVVYKYLDILEDTQLILTLKGDKARISSASFSTEDAIIFEGSDTWAEIKIPLRGNEKTSLELEFNCLDVLELKDLNFVSSPR